MSQEYRNTLLQMMIAPTLEQTITLGMTALDQLIHPCAGALLLWDLDMERYIVGEVFVRDTTRIETQFRRDALRIAAQAYAQNKLLPRCLHQSVFYLPLNTPDANHIGAYLYEVSNQSQPLPPVIPDQEFSQAAARALWSMSRIEQADREHAELVAERERLEHLLRAVEQQQMTIDRLLTLERQFSASLEVKIEERTVALREAQARLIQSEKLAVIGQLASSLAHEINNPVQAIQSGLGLAISELESGQIQHVHDDLLMIQNELERIQTIFKQMLDFQRPATFIYRPLDLNAICEGVRILMRKKLQELQIELRLELEDGLPRTCGDSNQMKQVLINLVLNAAEAMSESGGHILIKTQSDKDHTLVSVIDNGSGIQNEHLSRLFEPLFTTKTRGLGLGLAISQEIIQNHQGSITVTSTLGEGTNFTFTLPRKEFCHDDESPSADC